MEKLFDFVNNVTDATKTDIDNMLNNPGDELKNTLEDMRGSIAITAGAMLIVGSGGLATPIGVALIIGGSAACFNAAGVNSINDLTDPQKFLQGAMSVTMSLVGCGEAKAGMSAVKITSSTINKETGKTFIKATAKNSGYGSIKKAGKKYVEGKVQSWGATGFYNFYSGEMTNG